MKKLIILSLSIFLITYAIQAQEEVQEDSLMSEFENFIIPKKESKRGAVGSFGKRLSHLTSFVNCIAINGISKIVATTAKIILRLLFFIAQIFI